MQAAGAEHPTGLKLASAAPAEADSGAVRGGEATPALPASTVYQRGQFTFNRRFFETKFPGFFGVVRRDADRDMVLVIKSARGEYVGQRISRIAANDFHLQVQRGACHRGDHDPVSGHPGDLAEAQRREVRCRSSSENSPPANSIVPSAGGPSRCANGSCWCSLPANCTNSSVRAARRPWASAR